ncbi:MULTISPECIES: FAD-NAD(P)-binding protein [unclassified Pseudocitrobacter]|uniref:FAD-NAD(P)-binding protein n=1 Tax=unclassified Pseudocitrobacter TaxID=2638778 RepID=UPI0023E44084|nr:MULTISPECIES: FAD-NAD(P)-binding protein [unclassified Pseudocitrobacter]MDF3830832.1 FAD-NAD(P)-binding protein [Pseudocitrobacter sp. 2023EL-00150]MEC5376462.1 FAD-NAD(P)-binding protein [Pseudocitrobacter sp. MW920760]
MKNVAIVGVGPTGIYTFHALIERGEPLAITLFEQAEEAGVGMPYNDDNNATLMLANIASIEIPPIFITYLEWLHQQSDSYLARFAIKRESLHDRQFLPRVILGDYYRDCFLALVEKAERLGFGVSVREASRIADIEATGNGVQLWIDNRNTPEPFDYAVIATGHMWPEDDDSPRDFYPSPWTGLMDAHIAPCRVGIMGASLSGLDAAMAVVSQHGKFIVEEGKTTRFQRNAQSQSLQLTLMSRSGILPEADFYCPLPYEPLAIATEQAIEVEIAKGSEGLLNRVFQLIVSELEQADPQWSARIGLNKLNADTLADAWFADRKKHDPFYWAQDNLEEVERNKREKHTVPWRYTVLRLHEIVEEIVPHLNEEDRQRFKKGLARVFIDNYAAIPSESIRRLLALREAGLIHIRALGNDYEMQANDGLTTITTDDARYEFDVFIDARGQKALKTKDLPFPTLRKQLLACGDDIPDVGDDYTLQAPDNVRGRIAFGALPWLMHDRPFVQGLVVCAEIGAAMAKGVDKQASGKRKKVQRNE